MSNLAQQENRIKKYLGRKLSEGKLILFTGASFSSNAKDMKGRNLPLAKELAKEISNLIGVKASNPALQEIFAVSIQKNLISSRRMLFESNTIPSSSTLTDKMLLIWLTISEISSFFFYDIVC